MTDADIERIARRLCAIRGWNPDDGLRREADGQWFLSNRTNQRDAEYEVRAWAQVAQAFRDCQSIYEWDDEPQEDNDG